MTQDIYRQILFSGPLAYACHRVVSTGEGSGADTLITEANQAFADLCNLDPKQLTDRRINDVFPAITGHNTDWADLMAKTALTGSSCEFTIRRVSSGEQFDVHVSSPMKDHCITLIARHKASGQPEPGDLETESPGSSLFHMMALGVVYQNADGLITRTNPAAERILGLTADQMKGRASTDQRWKAIREDGSEYPGNEHPSMLALKTGQPVFGKIMGIYNPVSETTRWILVDAVPEFRNGETKPYRAFTTFSDITERKIAEDRLRESEEKMAGIFKVAPAGIGFLRNRVFQQVNRMVCELTGYSEEELIGHNARMLYPDEEEYATVGREKYRQISETGTGTIQTRWRRKDGALLNVILSSTPVDRSDPGKGVIFTVLDITGKQKTEDELKESEQKFRAAFYISPDLISITRLSDGKFVDVNHAFIEKSGFSRKELIGHTTMELNIWENTEERNAFTRLLTEQGHVVNIEADFRIKDGTFMTGLLSAGLLEIKGEKHLLTFIRDITGRKKMEMALRHSEELHRTVVSSSGEGIVLQDEEGKILTWNKSAEDIFGIPEEQALGQHFTGHPFQLYREDGSKFAAHELPYMRTFASGKPVRNVLAKLTRDSGEITWINLNASPVITGGSGKPSRVVTTFSDITVLKTAQDALTASAEVARSIPLGLLIYRYREPDQFTLLECNPAALELTRRNYESSIGKEFDDLWKGGPAHGLKQDFLLVMNQTKRFLETEIFFEDERISGIYRVTAFRINDSTLGVAFEDISEMKITENELIKAKVKAEENGALLRTIIENAPFEIWARDNEEVGILENQNSINHVGSILGLKPSGNGIPEEVAERWRSNNRQVLNGNILNQECIYTINHEAIAYQQIIAPLRNGEKIEGIVGFNININERRKAEEHIRKLNEELENRVEERTRELLIANKELEAFAYTVSHDLRAPLRAIEGFTNILREDYEKLLSEDGTKVLGIITENTSRMGTLIDDLLSFSRYSRSDMNLSMVDMNSLVTQVYEEITSPDQQAVIRFSPEPLPAVMADISLIKQVWTNLISNAVKFSSGRQCPEITVKSGRQENKIQFEIRDNGVGFNMKYAGKLFGVFQRLHSLRDFEGSGVGLAIVQRIVVRHGGSVWAHSEPGKGASFYFSLPDRKE